MRTTVAFIVAPLCLPLVLCLLPAPEFSTQPTNWWGIEIAVVTLATYLGMLALGVPIYSILTNRGATSLWVALLVGLLASEITAFIVIAAFGLVLGNDFTLSLHDAIASFAKPSTAGIGALGIAVAAVFWFIARPDRDPPR